jgi:hypothetical protein
MRYVRRTVRTRRGGWSLVRSRAKLQLAGVAAALALSAAFATAATAAVVSARPCYREGGPALFLGTGFQPGQPVAITLDGQQLATRAASASGTIVATYTRLPPIPRREMSRSLTMSQVTNPAIAASATFTETKVYVVTKPRRFRPGSRLRIRAAGFYGAGPTLYAHVRGPRRRNLRIGRVVGPCGKVSATRKVILKRGDPVGVYPTQFDTVRRYAGLAVPIGFRKSYRIRRIIRFTRAGALSRPPLGGTVWASARD